jgi:hypothetical protein
MRRFAASNSVLFAALYLNVPLIWSALKDTDNHKSELEALYLKVEERI